jgi:hypothetical protein
MGWIVRQGMEVDVGYYKGNTNEFVRYKVFYNTTHLKGGRSATDQAEEFCCYLNGGPKPGRTGGGRTGSKYG